MTGRPNSTEYDFWRLVDVGEPDACWPWTGSRFSSGYGAFGYRKKKWRSHRLAYHFCHGDSSGIVLHTCDNPPCCNPLHLFLATHEENMLDMVAKGRQARGDRHGKRLYPQKLTPEDVVAIHALKGKLSQREIAGMFGVHQVHVSRIQRGERWA
jgi:hypothetical protein